MTGQDRPVLNDRLLMGVFLSPIGGRSVPGSRKDAMPLVRLFDDDRFVAVIDTARCQTLVDAELPYARRLKAWRLPDGRPAMQVWDFNDASSAPIAYLTTPDEIVDFLDEHDRPAPPELLAALAGEAPNLPDPPAKPKRKTAIPKAGTPRGGARTKLIAALTTHHDYANGGALNHEPIQSARALSRMAAVSPDTARLFFGREFGGVEEYKRCCRSGGRLAEKLAIINGDIPARGLIPNPEWAADRE